jgi:hypothetical protein
MGMVPPPAHNTMASRTIIDQLTPLLPKDDEEAASKVKQLHVLLEAAMLTDAVFVKEAGRRGQETGHCRF